MAKDLALRVSHLSGHKSDGFAYIVVVGAGRLAIGRIVMAIELALSDGFAYIVVGVGRLAIGRIVMAIHLALSVSFLSGHKSDGFA